MSFCFSILLHVYDRLKHQLFIICTAPLFIWGIMILARNSFLRPWGVCWHRGHCWHRSHCWHRGHCRQGPWKGTSPPEGGCPAPLPSCPGHMSQKPGAFCRSCPLLSLLLGSEGTSYKHSRVRISLLLTPSSPATQRVPFLGAAHARQLRSAARAACSGGHGLFNTCSLALMWGERAVDKAAHTAQGRHESGHGRAASLTSVIKTRGLLPLKGDRGNSWRSTLPCACYREAYSPV